MLKRIMNVALVIVLAFSIPILFSSNADAITSFLIFLGFGLAPVAGLNYILFGKLTLWHKD